MTDTAELIARARLTFRDRDGETVPGVEELCVVLATQTQEIERLRAGVFDFADDTYTQRDQWRQRAEAAEAEVKRITQMAIGSIYAEWERRVEAAEARVREVEALYDVTLAACDTWKADRDAIEAKTIERAAQVAEDCHGILGRGAIAAAIRALGREE